MAAGRARLGPGRQCGSGQAPRRPKTFWAGIALIALRGSRPRPYGCNNCRNPRPDVGSLAPAALMGVGQSLESKSRSVVRGLLSWSATTSRAPEACDWVLRVRRRRDTTLGCEQGAFDAPPPSDPAPLALGPGHAPGPALTHARRASGDSFSIPKIRETMLRYLAACPARPIFQTSACIRPGTGGTRLPVPADRRLH
jgi:hypothetical protein